MSETIQSNNPPVEARGAATFTLKRVTGEIEIRGVTPDHLWAAQVNEPDYRFGDHEQLGPMLWAVKGMRVHGSL